MKVTIEYCVMWNYQPKAASLAEAINKRFNITPELIQSTGGAFEVAADGKVIFSKKATGRFPENSEIIAALELLV